MNLHDLFIELEADVASLFARFRSHPVVQAAAASTVEAAAPNATAAPVESTPAAAPSEPAPVAQRSDGFALVRGGAPLVNTVTKDVEVGAFTFNVPDGATGATISVAGAPGGGWFHSVTYAVNGAAGPVIPLTRYPFAGTNGTELELTLAPGDYSMPLTVDGPPSGKQNLAVQYYP